MFLGHGDRGGRGGCRGSGVGQFVLAGEENGAGGVVASTAAGIMSTIAKPMWIRSRSRFTRTCTPRNARMTATETGAIGRSATGMKPGGGTSGGAPLPRYSGEDFVVGSSATSPRNQEVWSIRRALDSPAGRSAIERRRQTPGRKSQPAGRMNNTGEDAK